MAAADYTSVVQQLYVAYFGRPADPVGLANFTAQLNTIGAPTTMAGLNAAYSTNSTVKTLVDQFGTSAESAALYTGTTLAFVNSIYQNVLNRAADLEGLLFWAGAIDNGSLSRGKAAMSIMAGAQANTTAQGLIDAAVVANKTTVAGNFTAALDTAAEVIAYSGNTAAATARAMLGQVTNTTDTVAFQATVTSTVSTVVTGSQNTVGTTYTLTVGSDTGASFVGGSANDTFVANNVTAGDTWTVGDAIDGGAGTDTFNVTQTNAITIPTGATVTNIETANFLSGTSGTSLNTTSWTGLTALNITAPGAVTATAAATTDITVTDATQAASAISVNGGKAVSVTGSTSVASAGTGGTVTVGATTAAAGAVSVTENVTSTNVTDASVATGGAIAVTGGTAVTVNQNISGASVTTANVGVTAVGGAVTVTGNASTTAVTVNQSAAVVAVKSATVGVHGIKDGAVTINDKNAGSTTAAGTITTATLKNYGDSTINSNALTTVNLEGTGGTLGITTNSLTTAANTALALNVNGLSYKNAGSDNAITVDSDVKTLNITSSTAASTVANVTASGATAVNVAGDAALTLTDNTFAAATAITVTNTAGATFGTTAIAAGTLFTGGAGNDSIILSNSFTKAITMGAGNDTVTVGGTTIGTGGSVAAGDGTDTIKMTSAQAATFDNDATFNTKYTGFEVLELSDALGAATTLDLAGLNSVSKVVLDAGGADAASAVLSNFATGGTVETQASSTGITVNIANALFNSADTLNLSVKSAAAATTGSFTAAGVETLNISLADATATGGAAVKHVISTLTVADATTINVSGNNGLTITAATGSTKVATFDASGVVGNGTADTAANLAVTYTSLNTTTAVTMKGGAGDDVLTAAAASTFAQTITGGNGADTITGGAGNDSIDLTETTAAADTVQFLAAGSNGVDTITGFAAGTGADIVNLVHTATTVATADGAAAVVGTSTNTTLTSGAAAFALTGASSTTSDVVEITATLSSYGNLGLAGATSGTELLKALSSTDSAATSITATTADDDFYLVAYQNGNAYLYQVTNDANTAVVASEISLVGVFNGVAAGAFATGDFLA